MAIPDDGIDNLRKIMVPDNMKASQALRDFLVSRAEAGQTIDAVQSTVDLQTTLSLLISSHLEVVHVLGAMEHNAKAVRAQLANLANQQQAGRHAANPE